MAEKDLSQVPVAVLSTSLKSTSGVMTYAGYVYDEQQKNDQESINADIYEQLGRLSDDSVKASFLESNGGVYENGSSIVPTAVLSVMMGSEDVTDKANIICDKTITYNNKTHTVTAPSTKVNVQYDIFAKVGDVTFPFPPLKATFSNYRYYGVTNTDPSANIVSALAGLHKELSTNGNLRTTSIPKDTFFVFAVKGEKSMKVFLADGVTEVTEFTKGTCQVPQESDGALNTYSYIVLPKAKVDWSFSIRCDADVADDESNGANNIFVIVGESGGTTNYALLENKPSINGNTLVGNKSSAQLGLAPAVHSHPEYLTQHQSLADYALKSEIPSVEGLATENYVNTQIANAQLGGEEVDMSGYLTKDEATQTYAPKVHNHNGTYSPVGHNHNGTYSLVGHTHDYLDKENADGLYAEKAHNHDEAYLKKGDIANWAKAANKPSYTAAEVGASPTGHTHDEYAKKSDIPDVSGKADRTELFSGSYEDLTDKPTIPSLVGLATEQYVKDEIAKAQLEGEEVDLSGFLTKSDADKSYQPKGEYVTSIVKGANVNVKKDGSTVTISATDTKDYPSITGKPKIAGVELSGDKSAADLGLAAAGHNHDGRYLQSESDPTVPSHVKSITEQDIANWNGKSNFNGSYNALTGKPTIPATVAELTDADDYAKKTDIPAATSDLTNDSGFLTSESDPTVPAHVKAIKQSDITKWNNKSDFDGSYNSLTGKPSIPTVYDWATQQNKPDYTPSEVGAAPAVHSHDEYLTEHQSLEGYAKKTDIPSLSGYLTSASANNLYAPKSHSHSEYQPAGSYADADHNHDDKYQPKGSYAASVHSHDDKYSPLGHTHDNYITSHLSIRSGANVSVSTDGDVVTISADKYEHPSFTSREVGRSVSDKPAFGGNIYVPFFSVNDEGHVTEAGEVAYTLPSPDMSGLVFSIRYADNGSNAEIVCIDKSGAEKQGVSIPYATDTTNGLMTATQAQFLDLLKTQKANDLDFRSRIEVDGDTAEIVSWRNFAKGVGTELSRLSIPLASDSGAGLLSREQLANINAAYHNIETSRNGNALALKLYSRSGNKTLVLPDATASANGLMSADDKQRLDALGHVFSLDITGAPTDYFKGAVTDAAKGVAQRYAEDTDKNKQFLLFFQVTDSQWSCVAANTTVNSSTTSLTLAFVLDGTAYRATIPYAGLKTSMSVIAVPLNAPTSALTSGSGLPVTSGAVYTALQNKQDNLTAKSVLFYYGGTAVTYGGTLRVAADGSISSVDANPVQNGTNAISSGWAYNTKNAVNLNTNFRYLWTDDKVSLVYTPSTRQLSLFDTEDESFNISAYLPDYTFGNGLSGLFNDEARNAILSEVDTKIANSTATIDLADYLGGTKLPVDDKNIYTYLGVQYVPVYKRVSGSLVGSGSASVDCLFFALANADNSKQYVAFKTDGTLLYSWTAATASEQVLNIFGTNLASANLDGLMSKAQSDKLGGIEAGANKYIHPTSFSAAQAIGQSANATDVQFALPQITVNQEGHVTAHSSKTVTVRQASASQSGIISAADYQKIMSVYDNLNGIDQILGNVLGE